jgi:hypothetical protein
MILNPCDQLDGIREFNQVIVCAEPEGFTLGLRIFFRRQHDDGDGLGRFVCPVAVQQRQAVHGGHDEVLEDYCWLEARGDVNRLGGIAAEVQNNFRVVGQRPAHCLTDNDLIVDEQDSDRVVIRQQWGYGQDLASFGVH